MRAFVAIFLLFLNASPAFAWSEKVHRAIADAAFERLTPKAKSEIDRLIATDKATPVGGCAIRSFGDAAAWPDCVRGDKYFIYLGSWHYDNVPACWPAKLEDYCPKGSCASAAIDRAIGKLKDKSASDKDRLKALALLTHFIADIHQPLHAIDAHRGGKDVPVTYTAGGDYKQTNLHHIWDDELVAYAFDGAITPAAILTIVKAGDWGGGSLTDWVQESHALAMSIAYGNAPGLKACPPAPADPIIIDRKYAEIASPIIRVQIARATARLAASLNETLK